MGAISPATSFACTFYEAEKINPNRLRHAIRTLSLTLLLPAFPAIAAEGETAKPFAEVVVTARRREEAAQKVPVAITALSSEAMDKAGIKSVEDLRFHAPALQVAPSFFGAAVPGYTIRSQRQAESMITQDPSVGVYFADVVLQRPHGSNQTMYDIDSVQVLKGPQGTLFGRNTTGGAVLINPKKPVLNQTEGELGFGFGNYAAKSATAVGNLPIGNSAALRLAGQTNQHDGYTQNKTTGKDLDDQDSDALRFSLLWDLTENLQTYFVYDQFRSNDNGTATHLVESRVPAQASTLALQDASDFHTVFGNDLAFNKVDTSGIYNTTTYDSDSLTIKNILGYREVHTKVALDYDASPISLFATYNRLDAHQFSEELQFLGNAFDDHLNWITGLYYFREFGTDDQNSRLAGTRANFGNGTNTSKSVFAQATWHLPGLEKLSLTAGIRKTWDERETEQFNKISSSSAYDLATFDQVPVDGVNVRCRLLDAAGAVISPCDRTLSHNFSEPTWTLSADYQVTDDTLVYLAHRRGYRSGLFNIRGNTIAEIQPVNSEIVKDIELGVKSEFNIADMPVRTNIAIYQQKYEDIQRTLTYAPNPPSPSLITLIVNAASATIRGYEIEATILPLPNLEISATYSMSEAKYDEFTVPNPTVANPANVVDGSNNRFGLVPQYTGSLSARYTLPLAPEVGDVSIGANYYSQSRFWTTDINLATGDTHNDLPHYALVDASILWNEVMGSKFDLSLYGKNLTNKEYYSAGVGVYQSVGFLNGTLGAPRTYGVDVKYHF